MMFSDEFQGVMLRPKDLGPFHPFNTKMAAMLKSANEYAKFKELNYVPPKNIPEHIFPRYNEDFGGWGMWNRRLQIWCTGEYPFDEPPVAETPDKIIQWYKDNI